MVPPLDTDYSLPTERQGRVKCAVAVRHGEYMPWARCADESVQNVLEIHSHVSRLANSTSKQKHEQFLLFHAKARSQAPGSTPKRKKRCIDLARGFSPEGHMLRPFWSGEARGRFEEQLFQQYSRSSSAEHSSEQLRSRKFQEPTLPRMFLGNVPRTGWFL